MKAIIILFICMSSIANIFAYGDPQTCSSMDSIKIANGTMNDVDTIPIVLFNEKEISYEEYKLLPDSLMGTNVFLDAERAVKLIGEKGKNGIIYANTRKNKDSNYFLLNSKDYYFRDCDIPAEFPGGLDSLRSFTLSRREIPSDMEKILASVKLDCYIDKEGNCIRVEVDKVIFNYPEHVHIGFSSGKMANSNIISSEYREYLKILKARALEIASTFPKFKPAISWLVPVNSVVSVSLGFFRKGSYDGIQYVF